MNLETAWDELLRNGELTRGAPERAAELLRALEAGTDDDVTALYLLSALCVARPEAAAAQIRAAVLKEAPLLHRFLAADDPEARAGAAGALVAAGAEEVEPIARLAGDRAPIVRETAALALAQLGARVALVERLLEDEDPSVRLSAAIALTKLSRIDMRVALTLARGAVGEDDAHAPVRAPWDVLFPPPHVALARIGLPIADGAVPYLSERLENGDGEEAAYAAEALLGLAFGAAPDKRPAKPPQRIGAAERSAVERVVRSTAAWRQSAQMEQLLAGYGLPQARKELERWLGSA